MPRFPSPRRCDAGALSRALSSGKMMRMVVDRVDAVDALRSVVLGGSRGSRIRGGRASGSRSSGRASRREDGTARRPGPARPPSARGPPDGISSRSVERNPIRGRPWLMIFDPSSSGEAGDREAVERLGAAPTASSGCSREAEPAGPSARGSTMDFVSRASPRPWPASPTTNLRATRRSMHGSHGTSGTGSSTPTGEGRRSGASIRSHGGEDGRSRASRRRAQPVPGSLGPGDPAGPGLGDPRRPGRSSGEMERSS